MTVKVKLSLLLRKFSNGEEVVEVSVGTPLACLRELEGRCPGIEEWLYDKQGELKSQVWLFVNGERIYGDDVAAPLKDGDELSILLAIVGG
jgi:molybdopterin converting factor small subunit